MKAPLADLVPQSRLATAYGVLAAFQGIAALTRGALAGGLYAEHRALLARSSRWPRSSRRLSW